jgi:hypothetical protein
VATSVAYTALLTVRQETVLLLSGLLNDERTRCGTRRWGATKFPNGGSNAEQPGGISLQAPIDPDVNLSAYPARAVRWIGSCNVEQVWRLCFNRLKTLPSTKPYTR